MALGGRTNQSENEAMRDPLPLRGTRGVLLLAVLAASPATALAQRPSPSFPRELEEYIATTIREWELPGAAIAVVKDGRVLVARGYGVRELGKSALIDAQTIFDIASLTKSFTSAAIGALVDDGTLSWDDPISRMLPEVEFADPYLTANVTLRDLLAHRTGLPAANGPTFAAILPRDRLLRLVRYVEPVAPFRARYVYSNLGYTVAGEAGARAAGTTWERLVTERLLRPLGMTRTTTDFAGALHFGNLAVGHALFGGEQRPVPRGDASRTHTAPAGAVQSSAADLARWMIFHLGDGTHAGRRVLSPDVMAAMHSPHVISPTTESFRASRQVRYFAGYGLGWQIFDYRGHLLWWHSGNGDGQVARMVLVPELRLGVAVLVNSWKAGGSLNQAIALRVIDHYLGVAPRDYAAEARAEWLAGAESRVRQERDLKASRHTGTSSSLPLAGYAGTYRDRYELPWTISVDADTLRLRYANGDIANVEHWHHDTFRVRWRSPLRADDGERPLFVTFTVSATGVADALTLDPGLFGEAVSARREAH
jgi:CubicO group peptidase (beta-lactamase class C family)